MDEVDVLQKVSKQVRQAYAASKFDGLAPSLVPPQETQKSTGMAEPSLKRSVNFPIDKEAK